MQRTKPFQGEGEKRIESLCHLFGPVVVVGAICLLVFISALLAWHVPGRFPKPMVASTDPTTLKSLLELQLNDYKALLVAFNTNISAQALIVATAVLVIIRRSDSLNFFGNSIPLSWLHVFIPILLIYLFMAHGYISYRVIATRMYGLQLAAALPNMSEYQNLFRDASSFDAWFMAFIDTAADPVSGIDRTYAFEISFIFVIVLGTLIGASHASALAMVCIGCRRYVAASQARCLAGYYMLPLAPLAFLLVSHFLFAYAGPNWNLYQPYVAVVTIPLMAFLLWLSAKIDITSFAETLQCLRRKREVKLLGPIERSPLRLDGPERTIALIGDSLSTGFHVGPALHMIVRSWCAWKTNWFLTLPPGGQAEPSVVMRLSALGTITGTQHASVAAMVNAGRRRSVLNHVIRTYQFCHQVDEVISGPFPDILLIWIGHNDVDWKWWTDKPTVPGKSLRPELLDELSDAFIYEYESQLRRLLNSALASDHRSAIAVFGLTDFASFFRARAEAEVMRSANDRLFPHLDTGYKSFVSMKPEHRSGMVELAIHFNNKLEVMCNRLGEQLSGTEVRLVYSKAMSLTEMNGGTDLNSVDAWHPSLHGHSKLADSAYPTVYELAEFMGWVGTNSLRGARN
jgi:hypothetical protein